MKKLVLILTLAVLSFSLQAVESQPKKDATPADSKTPACCDATSCEKSCCKKAAPKVESPKGAEQSGK